MRSFPTGQPAWIAPTKIPEQDYSDVPSLSTLPAYSVAWWKEFPDNQFTDTYGHPTFQQETDFWCTQQIEVDTDECV